MDSPSYNTYLTTNGTVTVRTKPAPENAYGFVLETVATEDTSAPRARALYDFRSLFWTFIGYLGLVWVRLILQRPPTVQELFHTVIPSPIRNFLIIVTPPPGTPFLTRCPVEGQVRLWTNPSNVQVAVSALIASGIPKLYVHDYSPHQLGEQRLKQGDVVFINKEGILLTKEYGPLPIWPGWKETFVVSEGRRVDRELVLVFVLRKYMEPPEVSVEEILDEETVDGTGRWR